MWCDDCNNCCQPLCSSSEVKYVIKTVGIQGPQGIQGPVGPQGPQGEPGTGTPAAAVADTVVTGATAETNATTINELLASLRAAGLLET